LQEQHAPYPQLVEGGRPQGLNQERRPQPQSQPVVSRRQEEQGDNPQTSSPDSKRQTQQEDPLSSSDQIA
jgi:hypothetical protein